jgi:hypothetical protein
VNIFASIVLSVGAVGFAGLAALGTVLLAATTGEYDADVVNWTILIGLAGIVLILIAMFTLVVRSLMRRRCGLWWPLAILVITALWISCLPIVSTAVSG